MKSLSILPLFIKYIFAFLLIISNANADIKISYEELDFLIKIGALNNFSFTVENNKGFNGLHGDRDNDYYEGHSYNYGYLNLLAAYSITSLDDKISTKTKISSNEIIIGVAVYGHCSCFGSLAGESCNNRQILNKTDFKKRLSHIDPFLNELKKQYDCIQADCFREELIHNLKVSLSSIYIANEYEKLLNYIRSKELIKQSVSTPEIRYTLSSLYLLK
jgi:hypothetical protein